ncbi:MAG: ribonucleoside-diphosphate reductase subunit alpha [Candidatus Hydrogenedentota bacterium]
MIEPHAAYSVQKRDGRSANFEPDRIYRAIEAAFKADSAIPKEGHLDPDTQAQVRSISDSVVASVLKQALVGDTLEIERIQDTVEQTLMKHGHYSVARRYIVYREERKKARALRGETDLKGAPQAKLHLSLPDGTRKPLDPDSIRRRIIEACKGFEELVSAQNLFDEVIVTLYDGITATEIEKAIIFAARGRIERDPAYSYVAARVLLVTIYSEVLPAEYEVGSAETKQRAHFSHYIEEGIRLERLSPALAGFDLPKLADALDFSRDGLFTYMGLQTLYDRYLIHDKERRIESPQYFWMRVAMGLAINEGEQKNERAVDFYDVLSRFLFTSSTPTLFNAGTLHPQLSSCYLSTIEDDLEHIFKVIGDDARLSKWAGGLGNDWTNVRATGGYIKGTNGRSQGVIPFLKVANDTAVAVNQGGKRKGAMCAYLETWHLDIEDFLDLRKNTGDERRRTHDMHTANWIPDLFIKRVIENGHWTLFNPSETPDLHHLYGRAFAERYAEYEAKADRGEIEQFKRVEAVQLWRKMLSMLFETGHPWITFKDPSNIRSPQDHAGVVHCSNLCTEILLNTSQEETAVCNLGSINLAVHTSENGLNEELIAQTVRTAVRMLDNVIDINYYPTLEARAANLRHRPVGLGIMGFQDALYKQGIGYASDGAIAFADRSMEVISFYAIVASTELARERGTYPSYPGSKWSRGLLPIDTISQLAHERGGYVDVDRSSTMDWNATRELVKLYGMRNSNTMAIAPTATISNITGVFQSIEPAYKHLFAKSNLSGEFTWVNTYLVEDLKARGLWDEEMIDDLKYFDGAISEIERIPDDLKEKYLTAFEIEPQWLIECASRRQKWIDMGQSLNLYLATPSGRALSDMYQFAWRKGLKTTYYLRTLAATQVEKSTVDINRRGIQPRWMKSKSASSNIQVSREVQETVPATAVGKACSILDPDCEACQ